MRIFFYIIVFCNLAFLPEKKLSDLQNEERAQHIISQLRCFVCQGQPLTQSHVPLAQDLRSLVRQKIDQGQNEQQIIAFITKRYGKEILLNPPLNHQTLFLWLAPFLTLIFGAIFLSRFFLRRKK